MYTLGINAVYRDAAACLVEDGKVVAAVEEERFTRVRLAARPLVSAAGELPYHAVDYCLRAANIRLGDLDHVAYSFDPAQLSGAAPATNRSLAPDAGAGGRDSPSQAWFHSTLLDTPRRLVDDAPHHLWRSFGGVVMPLPYSWHFVEHPLAHEASAFLASPFERAAVLTLDSRGERAATTYAVGGGSRLDRLAQVDFPHSLGLLYEELVRYLGFLPSRDEARVVALAALGRPHYTAEFRRIIAMDGDGRYTVQPPQLEQRFGRPRVPGEDLRRRHLDIACSLQTVLEETVLEMGHWLHHASGEQNLCLAGNVAANCLLNDRLRRSGTFRNIWIQPAAGDAGTALGAALWTDARQRGHRVRHYVMDHTGYGPRFDAYEIEAALHWARTPYRRAADIAVDTAALLAQGKTVGWFQGAMEFGPRALGGRSILASPLRPAIHHRINALKEREDYHPLAAVVIEDEAPHWFVGCTRSPFMSFAYPVVPDKAGLIPAVLHGEGTARVQTVNRAQNPLYYDLLKAFAAHTGVPILINTAFNTRGEPTVCTPRDALACFFTTPMDALVMGPFVVEKASEPS